MDDRKMLPGKPGFSHLSVMHLLVLGHNVTDEQAIQRYQDYIKSSGQ
jgi:hypothetical protein